MLDPHDRTGIEREFVLFKTVLAASSADYDRRRTSYFYRQQAIAWRRFERWTAWSDDMRKTARYFAKHYLATYREMLEARRKA